MQVFSTRFGRKLKSSLKKNLHSRCRQVRCGGSPATNTGVGPSDALNVCRTFETQPDKFSKRIDAFSVLGVGTPALVVQAICATGMAGPTDVTTPSIVVPT